MNSAPPESTVPFSLEIFVADGHPAVGQISHHCSFSAKIYTSSRVAIRVSVGQNPVTKHEPLRICRFIKVFKTPPNSYWPYSSWHRSCPALYVMKAGTVQFDAAKVAQRPRILGKFVGDPAGPTLVAVGSIHGNEPSGRLALERVSERLGPIESQLKGRVLLLTGNVQASAKDVRFQAYDLNRGWTRENIIRNRSGLNSLLPEDNEQHELLVIFRDALKLSSKDVYVLDLHSTSAGGR